MKYMIRYVIDFLALVLLYGLVFFKKWKSKGKAVWLVNTTMYVYLSFVLYFTLMPIITSLPFVLNHPYTLMNLVPFVDVTLGRGDFARQIILNVVMTMPFGFLFPLTEKGDSNFGKTVLYCFFLSLGIELLQPFLNGFRSSDITDIITNVTGGVVGYLFYLLFRPITTFVMDRMRNR